ncbi:MAG: site-specific integrase [Armatimonadetes bacterium]|nr:site-specific integrase [Armatimonadota bacterium]
MKTPKAYEVKHRPGLWAAKGIDPVTLKRKNYFGASSDEAARKAAKSFGTTDDYSLFSFYSNVYLPTVKHRSQNWLAQIGWAMDKYVVPEFGHRDLRELKRPELQLFFNGLGKDMKASSVGKVKIVLSGILRLAMADEIIVSNPLAFVRLAPKDAVEKTALTFDELRALIAAAGPLVRPFVVLAGCAGLRLGEALGVTRAACSKDAVLSVRQQVLQLKGRCEVSQSLKTSNSRRDIPLSEGMLEVLLNAGQVSGIWVCSDSKGGYVRPKNITRELTAACTKAEVPRVSPHELRHTFISLMDNEVEAPRTVVMALAGHSARSTTDGYSHVKIEQKRRWMERFWDHLRCEDGNSEVTQVQSA